jgi:hypothetical protein
MFGIIGELVNYVVHISKKKIEKKKLLFGCPNNDDQFLVSRNFRR